MSVKRTQLKIVKHETFSYIVQKPISCPFTCQDSALLVKNQHYLSRVNDDSKFKSSLALLAVKQEMEESRMSWEFEKPKHYASDTCISVYTLAFDVANMCIMMLYMYIHIMCHIYMGKNKYMRPSAHF